MKDQSRTKQALIQELASLRKRITKLEQSESERKIVEEALRENEQRFASIYNTVGDVIFHLAVEPAGQFRFVSVNSTFLKVTGLSSKMVVGRTVNEVIPEPSLTMVIGKYQQAIAENTIVRWEEISDYPTGRLTGIVSIAPVFDDKGTCTHLVGSVHDITERKRIENALREAEERYKALFDRSLDLVYITDFEGRFIDANDAALNRLGYKREEIHSLNFASLLSENQLPLAFKTVQEIRETGIHKSLVEFRLRHKDGSHLCVETQGSAVLSNGAPVAIQAIARDITDRKRIEKTLRRAEENFRRSLEESPLGVRIVTAEGETIYANRAILDINGCDTLEELKTTPVEKRYTPESFAEHQIRKEKRKRGDNAPSEYVIRIIRKDGEIRHLQVFRKEILWDGEKQFQVLYNDITERKQAEEALRQSDEKYRDIFDRAVEGIYRTTPTGQFFILNPAFARICGYASPEEMMEKVTSIANQLYTNPEDRLRFQKLIAADGEVKGFEAQFKHPTKGLIWISINSKALRDEQGNIQYYDGSIEDITERKQAEETLRKSEESFRAVAESAYDGLIIVENTGTHIYANKRSSEITGYSVEELLKIRIKELAHPDEIPKLSEMFKKRIAGGEVPRQYETAIVHKEGMTVPIEVTGTKTFWHGQVADIVIFRDITERKQAEEQIHASLREKEILLSEVHHRVKNNMQVISSLLDFQARSSGNPELTERLNESQSRIRSMAMIHEKLYGSKDFTRIDLAGYVRSLSQELFQSYKINPWKIALIVQTEADVYVDINNAIPCGLILNELISNALKHAFPGGRQGELQIVIRETKNTEIEIVVRDNGMGLPDDIDIHQPRTVGLYLVNGLVKNQIDGQIEVIRYGGTEFRIKFPL